MNYEFDLRGMLAPTGFTGVFAVGGKEVTVTEKQKRFVAEYLRQPNGTQAAIRAGYGEKNAASAASRLLRDPQIRQALQGIVEVYGGVEPEDVLRELRSVAFAGASDESGAQVKYASKLRALELLGRYLGLFDGGGKVQKEPVKIVELTAGDS